MKIRICSQIAVGVASLACSSLVGATSYSLTMLPSQGSAFSTADGINSAGQVVGSSYKSDGVHATLWNGTAETDLGLGFATSINNVGQVAGTAFMGSDGNRAAIWNGTSVTALGGAGSEAYAINSKGQVGGLNRPNWSEGPYASLWFGTTTTYLGNLGRLGSQVNGVNDSSDAVGMSHSIDSPGFHAMFWSGTASVELGTLGGKQSWAYGINNSGAIVGWSETGSFPHATLWNGTTITDLGTLGGLSSTAHGINNKGQVVGRASPGPSGGSDGDHATLWNGTTAIDLNAYIDSSWESAGWVLQQANGINDSGSIVGHAYNSRTGATQAFLLTAVPEPETYALMLAGLGLVAGIARRRKEQ